MPPSSSSPASGLFAKLLSLLFAIGAVALGLMFSLVLIPALLLLGAAGWFYLRWKLAKLQKAMAAQRAEAGYGQAWSAEEVSGEIIEGEAVVVREGHDQPGRRDGPDATEGHGGSEGGR